MQAIHVQIFFLSEVPMIFNLSMILAEFFYAFISINRDKCLLFYWEEADLYKQAGEGQEGTGCIA